MDRGFTAARGKVAELPADEPVKIVRAAAKPVIEQWAARLKPDGRKIYDAARTMIDAHIASN